MKEIFLSRAWIQIWYKVPYPCGAGSTTLKPIGTRLPNSRVHAANLLLVVDLLQSNSVVIGSSVSSLTQQDFIFQVGTLTCRASFPASPRTWGTGCQSRPPSLTSHPSLTSAVSVACSLSCFRIVSLYFFSHAIRVGWDRLFILMTCHCFKCNYLKPRLNAIFRRIRIPGR